MIKECVKGYLEVAVTAPIRKPLTYLPPDDCHDLLLPGMRVLVPLGRRSITGYILESVESAPIGQQIKKIDKIVGSEPFFPAEQVNFYKWIANYYHYPIGEVIKTSLPAGLTQKSGRRVVITESGRKHLPKLTDETFSNTAWFSGLLANGELSPNIIRKLRSAKESRLLKVWEEKGWVEIYSELSGGTAKPKTEICYSLAENRGASENLKVSEQKTLRILQKIAVETKRSLIPRKEITSVYQGAAKGLKSLALKNIVIAEEQQVYRDPFGESFLESDIPEKLTGEQEKALDSILPAIKGRSYAPFLLHGVTGSGKTEIYLQAAASAVEEGRSVLVLVPEIALATQLEAHFLTRFGSRVALLHSGLTPGQRFDQWSRIVQGKAEVVIGARSAVFAPLRDLGLIIVDEEHDSSYKQDDGFRYHARDLAVLRASLSGSVIILGTATPSITSYYHSMQRKYSLLTMDSRIEERPLPVVEVVDMQQVKTVSGKPLAFSPTLIRNLKANLERGEQSLIFLNRRGYANFMICRDCGQIVQCRHCQVSLTLHRSENKLMCHYCGFAVNMKTVCSQCQSTSLAAVGVGTERLEHELSEIMPGARLARLDRDICQSRNDYIKILRGVHRGEIDIRVGTQMITKGHHFPNVTLVGIVLADTGLGLPDFRAGERTFQLITQVTGRAGRGEKSGRVIVQTFQPEHYSIMMARNHDYPGLYKREIVLRKALGYPPFSRLVNIKIEGKENTNVQDVATRLAVLARRFQKDSEPEILGPAQAPLTRIRDKYRWQLLLKGSKLGMLHTFLHNLEGEISALSKAGTVKIIIDVDPEYMM
ncbi:MAG: primosomal protein N' [Deltaproteobacteria bacterium]|nr:primosomal protein N' [Deltaproteobacteria bacterium]